MISIPIDSRNSTNISKLYGNAPFFALLDESNGTFEIVKNKECGKGSKIVPYLKELGTHKTVFIHMGEKLFKLYDQAEIEVFTCKDEEPSIETIYQNYLEASLIKLNNENYKDLVDSNCTSCGCGI